MHMQEYLPTSSLFHSGYYRFGADKANSHQVEVSLLYQVQFDNELSGFIHSRTTLLNHFFPRN